MIQIKKAFLAIEIKLLLLEKVSVLFTIYYLLQKIR